MIKRMAAVWFRSLKLYVMKSAGITASMQMVAHRVNWMNTAIIAL
jgi:hypothetical protein